MYTCYIHKYIIHIHTVVCPHVCVHVERIAIAFAFINTKKIHFFSKNATLCRLANKKMTR